jgi:tetratricopeptide (TPR) repeat protein
LEIVGMLGWLRTYLERRRRRAVRAAKMAAESAEMAAMLQSNAPRKSGRRKKKWFGMFGGSRQGATPAASAPAPAALAPPSPVPAAAPVAAAAFPVVAAPPPPLSAPAEAVTASFPLPAAPVSPVPALPQRMVPPAERVAQEEPLGPEMYGPPPPPIAGAEPSQPSPIPASAAPASPAGADPGARPLPATPMPAATVPATVPTTVHVAMPQAAPVVVAAPAPRARFGWFVASLGWTLRVAVILLLVAGALAASAWPVWRESDRIDVEVLPIAVPAALAERGLGPDVAATRLVDALDAVLARTIQNSRSRPSKDDLGPLPAIAATPDGMSLRRLASMVRELRGLPVRRIAGEVTQRPDGRLAVRLRVPGAASFATAEAAEGDDLDQALAAIAPDVWRRLNPLVFAWYVADSGGAEDVIRPKLVALAQDFRLPIQIEMRVSVLYARSLVRSGRAAEAVATIEDLERRSPTYPLLWNVKAQALADLGRAEAALEAQKQAVQHEGTTVWSHVSSAHLMMKLGRPREALADLQSARRLAPNNFDAVMLESMVLLNTGRPAEALSLVNRVMDAKPTLPGLQEARGNALLANGRPDEALAAFDLEIARNPTSPSARLARANALRAMRRPEEALATIDDILRIAPRDGMAVTLRGWTLMEMGRHDQALTVFESLLRERPDDVPALHGRGVALAVLGRRPEAIGSLNRAMELQPGNRRVAAELARMRGVAPPGQGAAPAAPRPPGTPPANAPPAASPPRP